MPSGFIFLKSPKTHAHIHFVSAHVQDHTCSKSYCLPVSRNVWPLHMTQEAPWDCLWPWEVGWARSGNLKGRGDSCSVIPEEGKCVPHPALLKGWHVQGFLGREKRQFSFHSSQASSSSTWTMENGFPWGNAGKAAGVTASHNSVPNAKILGAGAVFFALPVPCLRLWGP